MEDDLKELILEVLNHMIETDDTIRATAKFFGISKTTVHKYLRVRLKEIDSVKYKRVDEILQNHIEERSSRGGLASKKRFAK